MHASYQDWNKYTREADKKHFPLCEQEILQQYETTFKNFM